MGLMAEEVKATMSKEDVVDKPVAEAEEEDETVTVTKNVVDDAVDGMPKGEDEEVTQPIHTVSCYDNADNDNVSVELPDNENKALVELKKLIQIALDNHEFYVVAETAPPPSPPLPPHVVVEDEGGEKDEMINVAADVVDEDETKTLEAIEETVVSVVSSMDEQQQQPQTLSSVVAVVDGSSPPAAEEDKQEVKTLAKEEEDTASSSPSPPEEVSIWGVPLMKDERTDTILRKFLRARDFNPKHAFTMLKNTIKWRKEFGIDNLLDEPLGEGLAEKAVFMHGVSKDGHPVCYNVYGAFDDKELYLKTFSDEVKRQKFLKWRIQFMEKSVRKLDFGKSGINTIIQVNDLKNSPGPGKWELRHATKLALQLFQDNYPEFVAKQVFINVPWWYVAVNKMISPFLTQRTKSKFVVAGPSKSAETLFNYIAPEQVPIQYGGFSKRGEFSVKDGVTQIIVKPTSQETVEFAVTQACNITWEVRVVGWDVSYGAEFVPNAKESYIVIIQKLKKVGATEESIITNNFKCSEAGKVVLTIHNSSSKKKSLLYRLQPLILLSH
ncbi:hypothetical protein RND81_09G212900 [Saponaria officinalis]|uniref:CRAL-TRIO domain-containing protein n=1 Tax=Saponaria officinalis TaxID=3572 RepID=A0AAW1IQG8_SAPOF